MFVPFRASRKAWERKTNGQRARGRLIESSIVVERSISYVATYVDVNVTIVGIRHGYRPGLMTNKHPVEDKQVTV